MRLGATATRRPRFNSSNPTNWQTDRVLRHPRRRLSFSEARGERLPEPLPDFFRPRESSPLLTSRTSSADEIPEVSLISPFLPGVTHHFDRPPPMILGLNSATNRIVMRTPGSLLKLGL